MSKIGFYLLLLVLAPVAAVIITTPMDSQKQYIFGLISIGMMFLLGFSKSRKITVVMVILSALMSSRYIWWRTTETLHFNSEVEAILGIGLYLAELYVWLILILGFLQTTWPLKRTIVPMPDDTRLWPTVDIYIPSYNESLEVVRDTVLAAQCIDYPRDKLRVYLLDDGKRSEFARFAADVGVGYITRDDNRHAKAGNLNHAMKITKGELICIFDCDHVATRTFLQATVGPFLNDPKLALLQTPHYFYSPDPFERNLRAARSMPNEGSLFYGPVQQGNDNWNATFFCGSCAVIRRSALGYWLAIEQGDKALAQHDIDGAEKAYRAAQTYDSSDSYALIGLGDVAMARNDAPGAERFWQKARRLDGTNITAVRRLAGLYRTVSPAREMAFIDTLPADQQRALADTIRTLRSDSLRAEADALAQQARWPQAADRYRQALALTPDDVWLSYRLAGALRNSGRAQQAEAVMRGVAQQHPQDSSALYAAALWFSGNDNAAEASATLHRLPEAQWSSDMRQLADRLTQDQRFAEADALREAGDEPAAIALLRQQPDSSRRDLTLADWALTRGDAQQALQGYQQVLSRQADNRDAALGRIEALVALQRNGEARQSLETLPPQQSTLNADRRAALAWQAVGETTRAAALLTDLKQRAASLPPSQDKALVYRDAARLEGAQQQPEQALADYRQAMTASGIASSGNISRATRNDPQDDWLKRSLRSDTADLYRQQQTTLTVQQDYSRNSGTGGISDFTAHTTMLQAEHPFADGRGFFRLDRVDVSAGTFATRNGSIDALFGSCDDANSGGCNRDNRQRDSGTALAAGWHNATWSADLGTTPLGFEVTNWTGGLSWKTDVKQLGVTLTASRRPIASSLLSYAGTRDPAASGGKSWGGVVATGGSIGLSYDQGGAHGVWGDISAHQITGKNVADNSRERLMGGYYYKLINSDNRRATVGLNSMLWHYQKDLSDYTFGQGGYYSPQQYLSFSVPVTWRQRTENWSFDLGGSVSWSHSQTHAQQRYPVNPGYTLASNPSSASSSGGGTGYTLQAVIERRLTPNWFIGAGVDIQQAKDYTPSHGLLYVRYAAGGWEGDLDMPPQPLTPYADFK